MHVLAVTPGSQLYGSDRMFLESVQGLLDAGHQVTVATGGDGPLREVLVAAGAHVDVVTVPILRRSYASPAGLARFGLEVARAFTPLVRYVSGVGADVVYVNTATMPMWSAVSRLLAVPIVVHVHEAESGDPRVVRTALSAPALLADRVVFNSRTSFELARADLKDALGQTVVVPNAVAFATPPEPVREHVENPLELLYVGRLSHRKGVDLALDAVALLAAEGVSAHLSVVGESFEGNEAYADKLVRRSQADDLRGRVTFHGFLDDPSHLVAGADIVLVPSRGPESFGNVLIEAVGAGRPTVAAAQAGLVEAAGGLPSVRLVQPDDARALVEGIRDHLRRWATMRELAALDATVVRERHDVRRYRQHIATTVESVLPSSDGYTSVHERAARLVGDARVLVVSPHLDDAVFSAHALLDLGRGVDVLNVLDGAPNPPVHTSWDRLCGLSDSSEAVRVRVAENAAAFAGTEHREISLGLCDSQYLPGPRPTSDTACLASAVRTWVDAAPGPTVIAVPAGAGKGAPASSARTENAKAVAAPQPTGRRARREAVRRAVGPLGRAVLDARARLIAKRSHPRYHEDHLWVRDTVIRTAPADSTILLYEDLPYLWGAPAEAAVAGLDTSGRTIDGPFSAPIDRCAKARGVGAYASQLTFMHAPLGPLDTPAGLPARERYWRIRPTVDPVLPASPSTSVSALGAPGSIVLRVAVVTFHRPEQLERLLPVLAERLTELDDRFDTGVIVIDNDPQAGARDVVAAPHRYVCEAHPGIAAARNRALEEAGDADLLVFIDDDEVPRRGWLPALVSTWERGRNADVAAVGGPVLPRYLVQPPGWVARGPFHASPNFASDTEMTHAATGNLLLDLAIVRRLGLRFPDVGTRGGEDTRFTADLRAGGKRIVWSADAVVDEDVPAVRATPHWVTQRSLGSGNVWGTTELELRDGPSARLRLLAAGGARVLVGGARMTVGAVCGSPALLGTGVHTSARGAGVMLAASGLVYDEYARTGRRWSRARGR